MNADQGEWTLIRQDVGGRWGVLKELRDGWLLGFFVRVSKWVKNYFYPRACDAPYRLAVLGVGWVRVTAAMLKAG